MNITWLFTLGTNNTYYENEMVVELQFGFKLRHLGYTDWNLYEKCCR